jgi:protein O-mannosyl-transferase
VQRAGRFVPYLALLLWTVFLYFPSVYQPFVYDDKFQIVNNPLIQNFRTASPYLYRAVQFGEEFETQSGGFFRPVFWMSLFVDRHVWGLQPQGFHAFNIVLHFLNGVLVFLLFRRWFTPPVALFGALAWVSLPIHSEVVAWISGRGLSLAAAFVLIAVLAAIQYAERRSSMSLAVLALSSSAALLSHEAGIVVCPLALLAAAGTAPAENQRSVMLRLLASSGIPLVVYTAARIFLLHVGGPPIAPLPEIALKGPVSIAKYIWWTIYAPPMSMERSSEFVGLSFGSSTYVLAWLTIIAAVFVSLALRRVAPLITFGIAGALCALLPFAQVFPLYQAVAERYVYAASIGIVLAIVAAVARLPRWATITILSAWTVLSVAPLRARIRAWESERMLYTVSLRSSPRSYVLYQNLGVLAQEDGRVQGAIAYYTQALKLRPSAPTARRNLARLYLTSGHLPDAAREFTELLKYVPDDLESQINLSTILLVEGNSERAVSLLRDVVAKHPGSYEAHMDLGLAYFSRKDPAARVHLETALQLKPDSPEAAYNLGVLEEEEGHFATARNLYQRALQFRPGYQKPADRLRELNGK